MPLDDEGINYLPPCSSCWLGKLLQETRPCRRCLYWESQPQV